MTKNTWIGIGVATAILILVVIWLLIGRRAQFVAEVTPTPTPTILVPPAATQSGEIPVETQTATPSAKSVNVAITSAGFSPSTAEIEKGGTVTWVNNDVDIHQVASTPHPVHSDYPPLNSVGTLQPGQSRSLTFSQAGTYRYHDHLNPGSQARVVVK